MPPTSTRTRDFAPVLRIVRAHLRVNQQTVATRAGVSQESLSNYECAKSPLDAALASRLIAAMLAEADDDRA